MIQSMFFQINKKISKYQSKKEKKRKDIVFLIRISLQNESFLNLFNQILSDGENVFTFLLFL